MLTSRDCCVETNHVGVLAKPHSFQLTAQLFLVPIHVGAVREGCGPVLNNVRCPFVRKLFSNGGAKPNADILYHDNLNGQLIEIP